MTIHKSKGLGADAIIVLNLEAGKYGFPGYIENASYNESCETWGTRF